MIRLNEFAQSVSEFVKGAWSAAPSLQSLQDVFNREKLQALFNRASNAFASLVGSSSKVYTHFQNPRTRVITSVTVAVLFVVKKVTSVLPRSGTFIVILDEEQGFQKLWAVYEPTIKEDARTLAYDAFVAKHGKKAIDFLDEPTKSLLRRPSGPVVEEVSIETVVPPESAIPSDRANELAKQLKDNKGDIHRFGEIFDSTTLSNVTDPEGIKYISKILVDALKNRTITYPQLRTFFDLQSLAAVDPGSPNMQLFRNIFLSFEGRFDNIYEEDRRVFKCENELLIERTRDVSIKVS